MLGPAGNLGTPLHANALCVTKKEPRVQKNSLWNSPDLALVFRIRVSGPHDPATACGPHAFGLRQGAKDANPLGILVVHSRGIMLWLQTMILRRQTLVFRAVARAFMAWGLEL